MDKTLVGTEESAGVVIRGCSVITFFEKLHKIHWEITVLVSLFNEVSDLETCNFVKVTPAMVFSCEFCSFKEHRFCRISAKSFF